MAKDKECLDLQLQVGKLQHDIEVLTRQLEKANKEVCQEKEKNAVLRQKLEQQEQECEELNNLFQDPEVRIALTDVRTGERDVWRKLGCKAQRYEQLLDKIEQICKEGAYDEFGTPLDETSVILNLIKQSKENK